MRSRMNAFQSPTRCDNSVNIPFPLLKNSLTFSGTLCGVGESGLDKTSHDSNILVLVAQPFGAPNMSCVSSYNCLTHPLNPPA